MNKKVADLMNAQFNKEFYSAYLYLGISKYFAQQNLPGFASWYMVQAREEQEHALKFYNYLIEHDQDVSLDAIAEVKVNFKDALAAVKEADKHEKYITAEIVKIMDAAVKDKDYASQLFLNWFITEQEEEEQNSGEMVAKVSLLGGDKKNLYLLDKEVGQRK